MPMTNELAFSNLLEHITQRPLTKAELACPSCGWFYPKLEQVSTTLLGGGADNHIWWNGRCRECHAVFAVESKGTNYWVVRDGLVLAGLPNCFENYWLTCATCIGRVRREYTALDGRTPVTALHTTIGEGKHIKHYRTFWTCEGDCKWRLETAEDYYQPLKEA